MTVPLYRNWSLCHVDLLICWFISNECKHRKTEINWLWDTNLSSSAAESLFMALRDLNILLLNFISFLSGTFPIIAFCSLSKLWYTEHPDKLWYGLDFTDHIMLLESCTECANRHITCRDVTQDQEAWHELANWFLLAKCFNRLTCLYVLCLMCSETAYMPTCISI